MVILIDLSVDLVQFMWCQFGSYCRLATQNKHVAML